MHSYPAHPAYNQSTDELIAASPYADRIKYLRQHPHLATKKVDSFGALPNCFGTAAFVTGIDQEILHSWLASGRKIREPGVHPEYICVPQGRPGFIGRVPFVQYLRAHASTIDREHNVLTFGRDDWIAREHGVPDSHAAVQLGKIGGETAFFEQRNHGGSFAISSVDEYIQFTKNRHTLQLKSYSVRRN